MTEEEQRNNADKLPPSRPNVPLPSSDREGLINSAISFLKNPSVVSSPLAKKIAFLESKGLTASEIQIALNRANNDNNSSNEMNNSNNLSSHQKSSNSSSLASNLVSLLFSLGSSVLVTTAYNYLFPSPSLDDFKDLNKKQQEITDLLKEIKNQHDNQESNKNDSFIRGLDEVKNEIKSLKAIMVKRPFGRIENHSFVNKVEPLDSLPQWQLEDQNNNGVDISVTDNEE